MMRTLDQIIMDRLPAGAEFCIYSATEATRARVCLFSPDRRQYIGREADTLDAALKVAVRDYRSGLRE